MRLCYLAALLLSVPALALQGERGGGDAPNGDPGVQDGDCYKNGSGTVQTDVKVNPIAGSHTVTVTEGDGDSGSGTGSPDPDGGTARSEDIHVSGNWYRVKNGNLEKKNDQGKFTKMTETDCPKDDQEEDTIQ